VFVCMSDYTVHVTAVHKVMYLGTNMRYGVPWQLLDFVGI